MAKSIWTRTRDEQISANSRGQYFYSAQYKGYSIVLADEGYSHPAWTVTMRDTLRLWNVQRTRTEFFLLASVKLLAINLVDKVRRDDE